MIEPRMRTPPADVEMAVTEKYVEAVNLNAQIHISAQAAQQNLYDMCMGFKKMRDDKLYKELGYDNFGDYCEQETGMKRRSVYAYISVVEKLPLDFVQSTAQIGKEKLYLLTTLNDEQRQDLVENTDLESATVRELKEKISFYQTKQQEINEENQQLRTDKVNAMNKADNAEHKADELNAKIQKLEFEIKELENRSVEVAVADNSAEENRLKEVIKSLEKENMKQNEALEEQYRNDVKEVREDCEKEKQQAIAQLKDELKQAKSQLECLSVKADDKEIFKAYLSNALDSAKRLCDFVNDNKDSANFKLFFDKSKQLAELINSQLEGC